MFGKNMDSRCHGTFPVKGQLAEPSRKGLKALHYIRAVPGGPRDTGRAVDWPGSVSSASLRSRLWTAAAPSRPAPPGRS